MRIIVGFLRKSPPLQVSFTLSSSSKLRHFPFLHFCFCAFSSSSKEQSVTVSHLINSIGFSHQKALSATKEKTDSFFAFFNRHGFSESQISKMVRSEPRLLVSNPEKSFLYKLQFFYSKGASKSDVARILVLTPGLLKRSLKNRIIPSYNFFKDFFQSEEIAMSIIKCFSRVLLFDVHNYPEYNIKALQEFEVPRSNIATLLRYQPRAFMSKPDQFRKILEEVKEMGFHPSKVTFVLAVKAMTGMSKSTWKRKIEVYKQWGWSEDEIRLAFLKLPWCMMLSEDKITASMDFFVNKMGKKSSLIAHRPGLLLLSLEKRVIPRYCVVQFLQSKGLINKDFSLTVVFHSTEKKFLHKFVNAYKEEVPQLLKLYQETPKIKTDCLRE